MDRYDDAGRPQDHGVDGDPGRPVAPLVSEARGGRTWRRTALVIVGLGVAAGLATWGVALAGRDGAASAAATPSASTPAASAEPSATAVPDATPTATPSQPASTAPVATPLDACGAPAPPIDDAADPWVGDYAGGIDGDVMMPLTLRWSVISSEDWSGHEVTATPTGLWLVSEDGLVVGVPAAELPRSLPVAMNPGSEGDGGGSEGAIEISTTFLACPDGTGGLPPAPYRARLGVQLDTGAGTRTASGDIPVFLPDYATATAP